MNDINNPSGGTAPEATPDEKLRGTIATNVLRYGFVTLAIMAGIIIVGGIVIFSSPDKDGKNVDKGIELVKYVFTGLLPVIGTWVGTVMAFYFGRSNFEAGSKAAQEAIIQFTNSDDKLRATKVTDVKVMIAFADIAFNKDIAAKKDEDINVQTDLLDFIEKNSKGDRLPILNSSNAVRYVLHQSTIDEFARKLAAGQYDQLKDKKLSDLSLADMINKTDAAPKDPDVSLKDKITKSVVFVAKTATLFEARERMKATNNLSQDIFITETGGVDEAVIGWITNGKIIEASRI